MHLLSTEDSLIVTVQNKKVELRTDARFANLIFVYFPEK